ncbi:hypothetical protein B0H67DRAFT_558405 [Lasiosphaeris hirsuta]|uniref:Uncharacterized protein n=1 Tax=Lasiosphaeris hirsuta TaxID=260670 RepID=A0AA39ZSL8_9PEZI|nr:hypothetical protein B0H67DRAFT_558405 [Lasiosphaeris hirsuta]
MHSFSGNNPTSTFEQAGYFTMGLHLPQQPNRSAHRAPVLSSGAVSLVTPANLSFQISYTPSPYSAVARPLPSLQQIRSSIAGSPKKAHAEANLSHDPPFAIFQYVVRGSDSEAGFPTAAAIIGRDRVSVNTVLQKVTSAFVSVGPPSPSGIGDMNLTSGFPGEILDEDLLDTTNPDNTQGMSDIVSTE